MKHVDPASTEFLRLSSREQAQIYHAFYRWKPNAIAEEFGVTEDLARQWISKPKNPCQKIPDETILEIKRRKRRGESNIAIAETLGVTTQTVQRHAAGLKRHRWSKIDPVKATRMKAAGLSTADIARHFGAGENGVRAALAKHQKSIAEGKSA